MTVTTNRGAERQFLAEGSGKTLDGEREQMVLRSKFDILTQIKPVIESESMLVHAGEAACHASRHCLLIAICAPGAVVVLTMSLNCVTLGQNSP